MLIDYGINSLNGITAYESMIAYFDSVFSCLLWKQIDFYCDFCFNIVIANPPYVFWFSSFWMKTFHETLPKYLNFYNHCFVVEQGALVLERERENCLKVDHKIHMFGVLKVQIKL